MGAVRAEKRGGESQTVLGVLKLLSLGSENLFDLTNVLSTTRDLAVHRGLVVLLGVTIELVIDDLLLLSMEAEFEVADGLQQLVSNDDELLQRAYALGAAGALRALARDVSHAHDARAFHGAHQVMMSSLLRCAGNVDVPVRDVSDV